jgi:hypothetical protein
MTAKDSSTTASTPPLLHAVPSPAAQLPELLATITSWLRLDAPVDANRSRSDRLRDAPDDVKDAFRKATRILSSLKAGDLDPWLAVRINTIILKDTRCIVYLDDKLEVQWWWLTRPDPGLVGVVQSRISQLTHESAFLMNFSEKDKQGEGSKDYRAARAKALEIRSGMAEALALALTGSGQQESERVLAEAQRNIVVAKDQHCRPIFLGWFFTFVAVVGVAAFASQYWTPGPTHAGTTLRLGAWLGAAEAGAFGAFLSALSRTRDLGLEPAAGHRGLMIEALARTLLGVGGALLARLAWHGGMFAGTVSQDAGVQSALLALVCIAAGASERILPALVGRAEALVNGNSTVSK